MSTTSTERMRERRRRRARREVQLTIVLHEHDLAEIAKRGYEGAASTDPKPQAEAVSLLASDTIWG
jgi:hypothetical protein